MKRTQHPFHVLPAKVKTLNPIMEKKRIRKPKLNNILHNNCPVTLKNDNVLKVK